MTSTLIFIFWNELLIRVLAKQLLPVECWSHPDVFISCCSKLSSVQQFSPYNHSKNFSHIYWEHKYSLACLIFLQGNLNPYHDPTTPSSRFPHFSFARMKIYHLCVHTYILNIWDDMKTPCSHHLSFKSFCTMPQEKQFQKK